MVVMYVVCYMLWCYVCGGVYCYTVFCPGFQKGRVPSEKGIFSPVSGPSKGPISTVN